MGFFDSLFGNGGRGLTLEDAELGSFKSIVGKGDKIIWSGNIKFLDQEIELLMSGDRTSLNTSEKKSLADILENESNVESQIDHGLSEEYESADKEYSKWRTHFNCVSISTSNPELAISFEEKESLYHFNVHFIGSKLNGISIDS